MNHNTSVVSGTPVLAHRTPAAINTSHRYALETPLERQTPLLCLQHTHHICQDHGCSNLTSPGQGGQMILDYH